MFSSWHLLPLMLLLPLSWRGINSADQPAQSPPPPVSKPNTTDVKTLSAIIKADQPAQSPPPPVSKPNTTDVKTLSAIIKADQPAQSPPPPVSKPNTTDVKTLSAIIKGESHVEQVQVLKPIKLELECTWAGNKNKLPNISGCWTKDGNEIDNSCLTVQLEIEQYNLKRAFNITDEDSLGNYSCVFGGEAHGDFIVAAPQMGEVRDKPIVTYVGDSVVIMCKMEDHKPKPNTWTWYKANGTDKEELFDTGVEPLRYEIVNNKGKTTLKVHDLTEADTGSFYCGAVYDISTSMSHVELKVITYLEPLKPFIAIVVEVLVLVIIILLCEKRNSKKDSASGNVATADQTDKLTQGESNGMEGSSTMRQRKV